MSDCSDCGGSGKVACSKCDGTGEVRNSSYIPVIAEVTNLANDWVTCPYCHGSGERTCSRCDGSGYDPD